MDVLFEPINDVVVKPPGASFPDAVVFFELGEELMLIDMTTPIWMAVKNEQT